MPADLNETAATRQADDTAHRTPSVTVADVERDRRLDLVVSNKRPDPLVYRGDGEGGRA